MLFFSFLYRTDQSWPELGIKDVSGCLGCGNASHIAFLGTGFAYSLCTVHDETILILF